MIKISMYPGDIEFRRLLQEIIDDCMEKYHVARDIKFSSKKVFVKNILDNLDKSDTEYFVIESHGKSIDFISASCEYGLVGFDLRFLDSAIIPDITNELASFGDVFIKIFSENRKFVSPKFQPPNCELSDGTFFVASSHPEEILVNGNKKMLSDVFENRYMVICPDEKIQVERLGSSSVQDLIKKLYSCPKTSLLWENCNVGNMEEWYTSAIPGFRRFGTERSYYDNCEVNFIVAHTEDKILGVAKIKIGRFYEKACLFIEYIEASTFCSQDEVIFQIASFMGEKYGRYQLIKLKEDKLSRKKRDLKYDEIENIVTSCFPSSTILPVT